MVWRMTLILLVLSLSIAACSGKEKSETSLQVMSGESVVPDGAALVQTRCVVCHPAERIDEASHDRAGWEQTVDRMIKTGASLSEAERKAVIDYLASR